MIKTKNFFRGIRIRAFYDTEPLKNLLPPNGLSTYMHLVGMHLQKPQKVCTTTMLVRYTFFVKSQHS